MYALECDGEPIAMHLGLTHGRRYMVPKLTYSELHHEYAPGHLLVQAVIQDCASPRIHRVRLSRQCDDLEDGVDRPIREYHRVHIFNRTVGGSLAYRARYSLLTRAQAIRRRLQATASTEPRVSS